MIKPSPQPAQPKTPSLQPIIKSGKPSSDPTTNNKPNSGATFRKIVQPLVYKYANPPEDDPRRIYGEVEEDEDDSRLFFQRGSKALTSLLRIVVQSLFRGAVKGATKAAAKGAVKTLAKEASKAIGKAILDEIKDRVKNEGNTLLDNGVHKPVYTILLVPGDIDSTPITIETFGAANPDAKLPLIKLANPDGGDAFALTGPVIPDSYYGASIDRPIVFGTDQRLTKSQCVGGTVLMTSKDP
ncbi:hypothetical protein FBU30_011330 [Linnemannia zychae]|nr:hypothetical protein FBU30_011330 [Linnemannia zychae]